MKIFALCADGRAVTAEVVTLSRGEVETALTRAGAARWNGAFSVSAYYINTLVPNRLRWGLSTSTERRYQAEVLGYEAVPEAVRDAGVEWAVSWAGHECAREWVEEFGVGIRPESGDGGNFGEWCKGQCQLPAEGDWAFLDKVVAALAGRKPTEAEQAAFRGHLLGRLWDLTPTRRGLLLDEIRRLDRIATRHRNELTRLRREMATARGQRGLVLSGGNTSAEGLTPAEIAELIEAELGPLSRAEAAAAKARRELEEVEAVGE